MTNIEKTTDTPVVGSTQSSKRYGNPIINISKWLGRKREPKPLNVIDTTSVFNGIPFRPDTDNDPIVNYSAGVSAWLSEAGLKCGKNLMLTKFIFSGYIGENFGINIEMLCPAGTGQGVTSPTTKIIHDLPCTLYGQMEPKEQAQTMAFSKTILYPKMNFYFPISMTFKKNTGEAYVVDAQIAVSYPYVRLYFTRPFQQDDGLQFKYLTFDFSIWCNGLKYYDDNFVISPENKDTYDTVLTYMYDKDKNQYLNDVLTDYKAQSNQTTFQLSITVE